MVTHEIMFFWTYEFCEIVNLHQLLNSGNMINLEFVPFGKFFWYILLSNIVKFEEKECQRWQNF